MERQRPEIRYAPLGDAHIAYSVVGEGPPDIIFMRSSWNHVELQWEDPKFARFLERLARMGRLITFDNRSSGLSDEFPGDRLPTFEDWADDAQAVLDAVGSSRAVVVCAGSGSFRAAYFVATHPERVSHLVICDGFVRATRAEDYPFGADRDTHRERFERVIANWATDAGDEIRAADPAFAAWLPRYRRNSTTRGFLKRAILGATDAPDIRHLLPIIGAPTLVIGHARSLVSSDWAERVRDLAARVPGAALVELPGTIVYEWRFPDPDAVVAEIERFVLGRTTAPEPDRVLATVLFTDIVESTRTTVESGDKRWRELLDSLDRIVHEAVDRFRGTLIKSTGDGHLATFDGPGRAIRCARTILSGSTVLGLNLRAGLHAGEVEVRGEDISGIAVNVARRVCDSTEDGCVFVSGTVPPLVAGSGIEFTERGTHELKGVPGTWQLFEVTQPRQESVDPH